MSQQLSSAIKNESSGPARPAAGSPLVRLNPELAAILVLAAINIICFANTLGCYFYADDFLHISFLHELLQKHRETLFVNLNTPWQEPEIGMFVRPAVELSLVFDYLVWKGNAFGYHLTNLFYQIASSYCVFGITRRLLKDFSSRQAFAAALFCASTFAAFPLHCEVVAWTLGRTDGLCGLLYFLSFWLFVKGYEDDNKPSLWASLFVFSVCLLAKEMAVSLPASVAFYILVFEKKAQSTWRQRCARALSGSALYWLLLAAYLGLRAVLLNTVVGGYVASFGDNLYSSLVSRIFSPYPLWRVLFPINRDLFGLHGLPSNLLHLLYMALGLSILVRAVKQPWTAEQTRVMLYLCGTFLICALPAYQVWYIAPELTGSRYAYIPSAPLTMLITLMVLPLKTGAEAPGFRFAGWLDKLSAALLSALILLFAIITVRDNQAYIDCGKQIVSMQKAVIDAVAPLTDKERLIVADLPQDIEGAHMFYSVTMFKNLFKPPFAEKDYTSSLASFEPRYLADENLLNITRLKEMLRNGYHFYFWDRAALRLLPVSPQLQARWLAPAERLATFSFVRKESVSADGVNSSWHSFTVDQPLTATQAQFVAVTAVVPRKQQWLPQASNIFLDWQPRQQELFGYNQAMDKKLQADGQPHTYLFAVGERKSWYLSERIDELNVHLPTDADSAHVLSVRALSGKELVPTFEPAAGAVADDGEGLHTACRNPVIFNYDASTIPQAASVVVEVSRRFNQFEQLASSFREDKLSESELTHIKLQPLKSSFALPISLLPYAGWYQVRLAAADRQGDVLGYFSDPIDIKVTDSQLSGARGK